MNFPKWFRWDVWYLISAGFGLGTSLTYFADWLPSLGGADWIAPSLFGLYGVCAAVFYDLRHPTPSDKGNSKGDNHG